MWYVYMLKCSNDALYTGITTNPEHRLKQHHEGTGSKYVRSHLPAYYVYFEKSINRSQASKREYEIKQLPRSEKIKLVEAFTTNLLNRSLTEFAEIRGSLMNVLLGTKPSIR